LFDELTISEKLSTRVPWEAASALVSWYAENPPPFSPLCLGFDLRRQFASEGYDLWVELMLDHDEHEEPCTYELTWSEYDRDVTWTDRLLVDELARAKVAGMTIPADMETVALPGIPQSLVAPQVDAILDQLAATCGARRAARIAAEEDEWQRAGEAEHQAWLASGEPDWLEPYVRKAAHVQSNVVPMPAPSPDLIKTSADFVKDFIPPDYVIDGVLQRRFCYSMTAQTGVGKTTVAMRWAAHVATGRPIGSIDVEKGTVLYFAGENPTDIQMRWMGLTREMGIDLEGADIHFIPGAMPLSQVAAQITAEVARKGMNVALVIVDTAATYFEGEDENSNTQLGEHARRLRSLTQLPGGPAVLVLCHPTKRAGEDDLIPRGGGAFLAEVDGNIALQKRDSLVVASVQGKYRGREFAPMSFELRAVYHPRLKDTKGRDIPTVVAQPINATDKARIETTGRQDEDAVLRVVDKTPSITPTEVARALCWTLRSGALNHVQAGRVLERLRKEKLVEEKRGRWRLTAAGQKELNDDDRRSLPPLPG
jgi:hypothetical protein